jgi:hypothetical protein
MKQIIGSLASLLLLTGSVFAGEVVDEGRDRIQEGRLDIIRTELQLSDEEAAAFWPIYSEYRDEIDSVQDRYAAMIEEYLERYDNADLSDEYADELIETFFSIKRELLDVQAKYLPKIRAVLPALKTARLFQLENKIQAEIDERLALVVPLIDPS